ncbi:aromatic compound dioxygenase [Choiromyces venosus 120613-1]|uniref:Aromatic compound dioxygenase n=1 Tax=Choiromyces venosus 120613-1 TaxID=1336337 RepID=A0A3N4J935_9PEZI|nr:aromatic compound dioxygenase [Choiromyces venosus 120613-1]
MHFSKFSSLLFLGATFLTPTLAHSETPEELAARDLRTAKAARSLEACEHKLMAREFHQRRKEKREAFVNAYVQKRDIKRRSEPYELTKRGNVFQERIACILAPEVTIGPCHLDNRLIHQDNREGERGVELLLDLQFVNVNTCEVVPNAYIDAWHANSTGKYCTPDLPRKALLARLNSVDCNLPTLTATCSPHNPIKELS